MPCVHVVGPVIVTIAISANDVTGEMRVIGVDTKKFTKTKAVLIVKFLTPQSLKDSTMQMYCTSLEPQSGLGQGADFSVLTAIKYTLPQAKSLHCSSRHVGRRHHKGNVG